MGRCAGTLFTEILRHLPQSVAVPQLVLKAAQELDKVCVTSRYPNGFASGAPADYFDEESSRTLIAYAREVFEFCRSQIH